MKKLGNDWDRDDGCHWNVWWCTTSRGSCLGNGWWLFLGTFLVVGEWNVCGECEVTHYYLAKKSALEMTGERMIPGLWWVWNVGHSILPLMGGCSPARKNGRGTNDNAKKYLFGRLEQSIYFFLPRSRDCESGPTQETTTKKLLKQNLSISLQVDARSLIRGKRAEHRPQPRRYFCSEFMFVW